MVSVPSRGRSHRGRVRARARLGQRVGGKRFAGRESGEEPLLLLVRAGELDCKRPELLNSQDDSACRADLRDLLDSHEREERSRSRAPPRFVEEEPEDLVLAVELDDVPGEFVRGVDLGRPRGDAVARKRAHELANLELFLAQRLPGHELSLGRDDAVYVPYSGSWQTASMLLPSASWTYAA